MSQLDLFEKPKITAIEPVFKGAVFDPGFDQKRLTGQLRKIYLLMMSGEWYTLNEISKATGAPESSVSAQLRNLRKPVNGNHKIEKQPRGDRHNGLWEYKLIISKT